MNCPSMRFLNADHKRRVGSKNCWTPGVPATQTLVSPATEPKYGLVAIERVDGIAVGNPVYLIVGRQSAVVQSGRPPQLKGEASYQSVRDDGDRSEQRRIAYRDARLDQLPADAEVGIRPDRVPLRLPTRTSPSGIKEDYSVVPHYTSQFPQSLFGIRHVFEHPDRPGAVETVVWERQRSRGTQDELLVIEAAHARRDI